MKQVSRTDNYWFDAAADKKIAVIYANWIRDFAWSHYCTFTFAWKVSDQQAEKTLRAFIERLEQELQVDVAVIWGSEKCSSGCGKPEIGRHFHVLLAFPIPVVYRYVEELWMSMAGRREDGAGALALPYDPMKNGAEYIMKRISTPDGDWNFYKLHLLLPEAETLYLNARQRRNRRRYNERRAAPLVLMIGPVKAAN